VQKSVQYLHPLVTVITVIYMMCLFIATV